MTDDGELAWAKLSGNWKSSLYRFGLARDRKCLSILIHDGNATVRYVAKKAVLEIEKEGKKA